MPRHFIPVIGLSLGVIFILACNLLTGPLAATQSVTQVAGQTVAAVLTGTAAAAATGIPASQTLVVITPTPAPATATQAPSFTIVAPTPIPPTSIPLLKGEQIVFQAGATSADATGHLKVGQEKTYQFEAGAGQELMAAIYSKNNDIYLDIGGADGTTLVNASAQVTSWQGKLAKTQVYIVKVVSGDGDSDYDLQIIIPAIVKFQPGAISAVVPGKVIGHSVNAYIARAFGGQTMTVKITSPGKDMFLTIYGLDDGTPLVRSSSGFTSWTGKLPITQDYIIEAVSVGGATTYSMEIIIK